MSPEKKTDPTDDTLSDVAAADLAATVESVEAVEGSGVLPVSAREAEPDAAAEPAAAAADDPDVTFESVSDAFAAVTDGPDGVDAAPPPQYGVGPFSIREVALGGVWLVAFVVSFFSVWIDLPVSSAILPSGSVWTTGIDWILSIGAPTVAVFLLALRRFSPTGIRRVGSLGIDQFASVAFSVSAVFWLGILWTNIARAAQIGLWLNSWVVWVEFILMLAGVLLTVFAPLFPVVGEDFRHRTEVPAHRFASPARPVVTRPATQKPAPAFAGAPAPAASPVPDGDAPVAEAAVTDVPAIEVVDVVDEGADEPIVVAETETVAPSAAQAFWALAPEPRDIVDEVGLPVFSIGPTAWALVIEDRGDVFVVRHEDGRIGYLTDVSGVMRG